MTPGRLSTAGFEALGQEKPRKHASGYRGWWTLQCVSRFQTKGIMENDSEAPLLDRQSCWRPRSGRQFYLHRRSGASARSRFRASRCAGSRASTALARFAKSGETVPDSVPGKTAGFPKVASLIALTARGSSPVTPTISFARMSCRPYNLPLLVSLYLLGASGRRERGRTPESA